MAQLAEKHQLIFYDQRGCGLSTGDPETISLESFVEDIEAIRISYGYPKITVLGHSWGGFLAMQYAIAHPEFTQKLILLNSMPPSSEECLLFYEEWERRMAPFLDRARDDEKESRFAKGDPIAVEKYYQIMLGRYCYLPEKALLMNLRVHPKGSLVNKIFRQKLWDHSFNFHDQLKQLQMPTLIVHGEFDPIPFCTAEKLHATIANSKYVLIPNCGHFPHVETPEELFSCLAQFLCE